MGWFVIYVSIYGMTETPQFGILKVVKERLCGLTRQGSRLSHSAMQKIDIQKLKGTPFQKKIWQALIKIPKGKTVTYTELARKIGKPKSVRAVANAVGTNPCAPMIPCHRVVRSDGSLGGYSGKGGVKTKRKLLLKEGVTIK